MQNEINTGGFDLQTEDREFLLQQLEENPLSLDLVSGFAGDHDLSPTEKEEVENKRKSHGKAFFSDLLFAVTHQVFMPETAESLWHKILLHKYEMSSMVYRNIKITVAALDYLSNISNLVASATVVSEQQFREIVRLSNHDGLTGLYNHTYCFYKIDMELKRYIRYGHPVSIMMIDIDHFKRINDRWGHPEGDAVLCRLSDFIDAETRECDICCRYGGEEFLVILPSTQRDQAAELANRLCLQVREHFADDRAITVSIGVASCSDEVLTHDLLVKKADTALFLAKERGRNTVAVSV